MIKVATPENIILGLEEENLRRLQKDNPIRFELDELTTLNADVLIVYNYAPPMMKYIQQRHPRECFILNVPPKNITFLQDNGVMRMSVREFLTKDVVLVYEKTMNDLMKLFTKGIGPNTVLDNRIKSYVDLM